MSKCSSRELCCLCILLSGRDGDGGMIVSTGPNETLLGVVVVVDSTRPCGNFSLDLSRIHDCSGVDSAVTIAPLCEGRELVRAISRLSLLMLRTYWFEHGRGKMVRRAAESIV